MNIYAFSTKTLFDPSRGVSISAFRSKSDYLAVAPLKVLSFAALVGGQYQVQSFRGDLEAKQAVGAALANGTPDDLLITHTDFHEAAVKIRCGAIMPGRMIYIDELVRRVNPTLRSVSLDKLVQLYCPPDLPRLKPNYIEGQHTDTDLVQANERDATLMLCIYRHLRTELQAAGKATAGKK
jgi:hypothetical protein